MGILWTTLALFAGSLSAQQAHTQEAPKTAECYAPGAVIQTAHLQAPATAQPAAPGSAEALLDELETADRNLSTLSARILYDREFEMQGDRQKWQGTLAFQTARVPEGNQGATGALAPPARTFAVHFTTSQIGSRIAPEDKLFLFDGRWFTERNTPRKMLTRREVVREGEQVDPMRLGDSPFPLPIGQRKEDILSRYDVQRLEPTDGLVAFEDAEQDALERFVKDCTQLVLTPKAGLEQTISLDEIRLWYRRADVAGNQTWLPRMARTTNKEGTTVVQLIDVKLNEPLPANAFDAGQPGSDWTVQEDRLD